MAVESTYPNYQLLRSRWVPRVPEHWSLLRAKNFLREIDDRSKTGEETLLSMRMQRGLVARCLGKAHRPRESHRLQEGTTG